MIEAILTLLQDNESSVSLLSRCILRELIKAYSQFPRVIKKLSYLHRQDLIQMLIEATNDKQAGYKDSGAPGNWQISDSEQASPR